MPPTTIALTALATPTALTLTKEGDLLHATLPPIPDGASKHEWRHGFLTSGYATPVVIDAADEAPPTPRRRRPADEAAREDGETR